MGRSDGRGDERHRQPSRAANARAARLRARYGLSPREARIAVLIAEGYRVTEIAAALGVSVFTVRAHLRAIFVKTGVDRQAALVRVVLTPAQQRRWRD